MEQRETIDPAELSLEELELLELMLEEEGVESPAAPRIPPRESDGPARLSFAQQRLWFLEQMDPGSPVYHIPAAFRLCGPLDLDLLTRSLHTLAQRHESLRTGFKAVDGDPRQIVAAEATIVPELKDLRDLPTDERETEARQRLFAETQRPFDLAAPPLLRVTALQLGDETFILQFVMHHIIADGWSMDVFFRELTAVYNAFAQGVTPSLSDLPIQYTDFAEWQKAYLQGEILDEQLDYWKSQLDGAPSLIELPLDKQRPSAKTFNGARQPVTIPADVSQQLQTLSQESGATLFMTVLALFKVLLYRLAQQESLVVGTPVANRHYTETEGLIGFFVNTLALHTDMRGQPTFYELLARVKETALGAYDHQDLPFEKLVEELQPARALNHNPVFQVMFALQAAERLPLSLAGTSDGRFLEVNFGTSKFDLSLSLTQTEEGLTGSFEYNTDLFEPNTVARMAGHLQTLAAATAADPDTPITRLPLLTPAEQQQILVDWNDTAVTYDHPVPCVHQLFERQVVQTPDNLALIFENEQLTYRELNGRANQLAHTLQKHGVGPDVLVGISVERSPEMVVALLGILKAGGAYLPLDPAYPQERLAYMLADSQCSVLLTQERLLDELPPTDAHVFCLDRDWETVAGESHNPNSGVTAANLAYVIYTSGSTGRPKGVMVTHRGVPNLAEAQIETFNIRPDSRVLQFASFSFDASVSEVTTTLLAGATLVLAPQRSMMPGPALVYLLRDKEISIITLPPSALAVMSPDELPGLKTIVSAGEACSAEIVAKWAPGRRFINAYGPSEATVCTTMIITDDGRQAPPIGCPINNFQTYVLDQNMEPLPVGVPGELYISAPNSLARGYLNRSDLTAEKFVPNPFSGEPGARLYRSGDLAKYRPDGTIEFLGRIDHQVKVRGFRIELGEIEAVLRRHTAVRDVLVLAREDTPGDKRLVAYLLPAGSKTPTLAELRQFLGQSLPDYMMPNAFVFLKAFPVTPNGKVDRRALPPPGQERQAEESTYVAPRNELERQLAHIWEDVLGIKQVGIHDNFFEMGGHSLLATRLFAQIDKKLRKHLPLTLLFQYPTVAQLGEVIQQQEPSLAWSALVPIRPNGSRPPFFCVHGGAGHVFNYQKLAGYLDDDQPFYGVQPPDWTTHRVDVPDVIELATSYLAEIRRFQPSGPYYLGGFCFGGMIVFEMARQLQAAGEEVALLALIEPSATGSRKSLIVRNPNGKVGQNGFLRFADPARRKPASLLGKIKRYGYGVLYRSRRRLVRSVQWFKRQVFALYLLTGGPVLRRHRDYYLMEFVTGAARKLYNPVGAFEGDIHMMVIERNKAIDPSLGWRRYTTGEVTLCKVKTHHVGVLKEPHVKVVAEELQRRLDEAQEKYERR